MIEAISLARIQVISRHILYKDELEIIHKQLLEQNVLIQSDEEIYNLIWLQGYYNKSQIILSVQIPNFSPITFESFIIKTIPINNTLLIPNTNNKIFLSSKFYQYITKPCIDIGYYEYCKEENIQPNKGSCIPEIIRNEPASCNFTKITEYPEITIITRGHLYVQTTKAIILESNCNQKQKTIIGQKLLTFNNCTIKINNTEFNNKIQNKNEETTILTPYNDVLIHTIQESIELPILHNWTIKNAKTIQQLDHSVSTLHNNHLYHIPITTIIILLIISFIIFKVYKFIKIRRINDNSPKRNHRPFWPSLRGEELRPTTPTSPPICVVMQDAQHTTSPPI